MQKAILKSKDEEIANVSRKLFSRSLPSPPLLLLSLLPSVPPSPFFDLLKGSTTVFFKATRK